MSTSKNKLSVQTLVRCAMIAAVYTVLCLVLQPFSYGAVQVRVAEAFCLLPVFGAEYIVGVTLGCLLANLLGSTMVDVVFGTAATLIACLATYALRNVRWKGLAIPASFPPVIANALCSSRILPPRPPWRYSTPLLLALVRSSAAVCWVLPWSS